mgnify:CR=1 FL=1
MKERYTVQYRLKMQPFQEHILNKRFEIGRKIYNALAHVTLNRYQEMTKRREYRQAIEVKEWKVVNKIRQEFGFSEYSFHSFVKQMQQHYKCHIDSNTAQKIATNLWKAYEKAFNGNGKKIHFKKYGTFNSLEGKSNKSGIRFKEGQLEWLKLKIPVKIRTEYEIEALEREIAYCRIVRDGRYYLQIVFKGETPEKKHKVGKGDVGLDIGTSTLAIASEEEVKIIELADKSQPKQEEINKLMRKMDRSRRATNVDNYNADGTISKGKHKWKRSKHYQKTLDKLKEIYRKQRQIRKYQHECLANLVISLGDKVYVEKMNFAALSKKSKKVEKNEKGKYKRRRRFGKSIANRAPAMFLAILDRKLKKYDRKLIEIDTQAARASQFNHFEQSYKKKKLSQRWNDFNGVKVQRDMYSAFLIMNVNEDLKSFNIEKCKERFEEFYELHEMEVERLKGDKNLSSIAI